MSSVNTSRPPTSFASGLSSSGTVFFLIFPFIVVTEVLLKTSVVVCPCEPKLKHAYGLSFIIVPAIIIAVVGFPWMLIKKCPSCKLFREMVWKPLCFSCTWIILSLIEGRFVRCVTEQQHASNETNTTATDGECENNKHVTRSQLAGLYFWLVLVLVICVWRSRRKPQPALDEDSLLFLKMKYTMEKESEKEAVRNCISNLYPPTNAAGSRHQTVQSAEVDEPHDNIASPSGLNSWTSSALDDVEAAELSPLHFHRRSMRE